MNFTVSEKDVLRIRANMAERGMTMEDLRKIPVEVGLQTEKGYPHKGHARLRSARGRSRHRHARGSRRARERQPRAAAGLFRPRARAADRVTEALLVPDVALGSDQSGRYVLVASKDDVVEQRKVEIGQLVGRHAGHRRAD